jgi:hypothetical protein
MLTTDTMVRFVDEAVNEALITRKPEAHAGAVEQIRVAVTLGFMGDTQAAEYIHLLQNGSSREMPKTSSPVKQPGASDVIPFPASVTVAA